MIKNAKKIEEFERKMLETESLSLKQKWKIFDALFKEAVSLGVFNDKNIMDGIEVDIKIARAIHSLKPLNETKKVKQTKVSYSNNKKDVKRNT